MANPRGLLGVRGLIWIWALQRLGGPARTAAKAADLYNPRYPCRLT